jgi:outer membrane protein OmpA-like peptidoglycan-associated protein
VRPGAARSAAALLLVACGLFVSAALDTGVIPLPALTGSRSAFDPPSLSFARHAERIVLAGVAGSRTDEIRLRRHAESLFDNSRVETRFEPGVIIPPTWRAATNRLLDVLAATDSATAAVQPDRITLRAVGTDADAVGVRLDALRDVAGPDMRVDADVIVVDSDTPLDTLCRGIFARASRGTVTFAQSGTAVGEASVALLDRIVDFANDCRGPTIVIIGHSDDVGEESWNREISLARARSVADYISAAGIPADRLAVEGRGSSEPVADNGTPAGRRKNRRVEFELREASP